MEESGSAFKILTGKPKGNSPLEVLGEYESTILEWISKKLVSTRDIGLIQLRIGTIGESL